MAAADDVICSNQAVRGTPVWFHLSGSASSLRNETPGAPTRNIDFWRFEDIDPALVQLVNNVPLAPRFLLF